MSFKLLASLSPNNFAEAKTFDSIAQVFNPKLNTLWSTNEVTKTKNWLTLLKSIFSRENIKNNPEFFIITTIKNEYWKTLVERVLATVPDDQLWALYFLNLSCDTSYRVNYTVYSGRSEDTHFDRASVFRYNDDYGTMRSLVTSDTFSANLMEKINKITTTWLPLFSKEELQDRPYGIDYNVQSSSAFVNTLVNMCFNKKYIRDITSNSTYRPIDVIELFEDGVPDEFLTIKKNEEAFHWVGFKQVVTDKFRKPIYKLLNYSANIFEVLGGPLLDKGETEENTPLYGVELELSTDYSVRELIDAGKNAFMACKSDGSVNGNKRYFYECVTRPMSLKMQKRQWAYFFSKLEYEKFDCTKNTNNGMHVHISRKAFLDKIHLHKFTWFFSTPAHRAFMLAMSERNENSFDQYSPVPNFSGTKGKSFANVLNDVARLRGAVNLKKQATVEVRLFRGIVSFASVLKNLEFVDAVLKFTEERSMAELSLRDFNSWLYSTPKNRYIVLKKWFEEMNIAQYFIYSDVKNVVFTEKNAQKVLDMVRKSNIKITEDHVKVLNEDNPGTFVLNKQGQLDLDPKFRNSIANLDRVLEFNLLRGWN